jgi:hypothetical protein
VYVHACTCTRVRVRVFQTTHLICLLPLC